MVSILKTTELYFKMVNFMLTGIYFISIFKNVKNNKTKTKAHALVEFTVRWWQSPVLNPGL